MRPPFWKLFTLRVCPQVANDNDLVDAACHQSCPLNWPYRLANARGEGKVWQRLPQHHPKPAATAIQYVAPAANIGKAEEGKRA